MHRTVCSFASLHLPTEGWPGWVDPGCWLHTEMVYPPADGYTRSNINRVWCNLIGHSALLSTPQHTELSPLPQASCQPFFLYSKQWSSTRTRNEIGLETLFLGLGLRRELRGLDYITDSRTLSPPRDQPEIRKLEIPWNHTVCCTSGLVLWQSAFRKMYEEAQKACLRFTRLSADEVLF